MFKGWSEGLSIQPREDLDPVAMLNVEPEVVTAPRQAPGSSPGHSWEQPR
jgi:hypothetical protein